MAYQLLVTEHKQSTLHFAHTALEMRRQNLIDKQ